MAPLLATLSSACAQLQICTLILSFTAKKVLQWQERGQFWLKAYLVQQNIWQTGRKEIIQLRAIRKFFWWVITSRLQCFYMYPQSLVSAQLQFDIFIRSSVCIKEQLMNNMIFVVCWRRRRIEENRYFQSLNTMDLQLSQSCQLKYHFFFRVHMSEYTTGTNF